MILLQDYLTKMLPIFKDVIDCAGVLLEKNAMNHAPTQEEMQQLENGTIEIKNNLEQMEKDAQQQAKLYAQKVKEADACNLQTIEQLTETYKEFDQLKEKQAVEEIHLTQVKRETDLETENLKRAQAELDSYRRQQEKVQRAMEKKRQEAIKWCWVPGYNIYLGIDYAIEVSHGNLDSLEHRCKNCETAIKQYGQKAEEYEKGLREIVKRRDRLSEECKKLICKSQELQTTLAEHKKQLIYWEDMRIKVSDLRSRLTAGAMAPDDLMELMDMMEMFGEGI